MNLAHEDVNLKLATAEVDNQNPKLASEQRAAAIREALEKIAGERNEKLFILALAYRATLIDEEKTF